MLIISPVTFPFESVRTVSINCPSPFVNENSKMQNALKILKQKNLGVIIIRNSKNNTVGVLSDGDIKRIIQKNQIYNLEV